MNSVAEPVLEGHAAAVDRARHEHDLLVLDVDALDHADPLRELEQLGLRERLGGVEAALALPDQRRVEALLDRRPDREGRREVVALDDEVGAVAHPDLVDLVEELVGCIAGEDVGEPGLDADAEQREQPALLPALVHGELRRRPPSFGTSGAPESVIAMSRYVQPRSRAAAKIGGLKRGSAAFRTASRLALAQKPDERVLVARVDLRRDEAAVALRSTSACGRAGSRSANVMRSKKSRRLATAATAAPTPPVPTTRTFISGA